MNVEDVMRRNPCCCSADASLEEVARKMVDHDCGEIPVIAIRAAGRSAS